MNETTSDRCLCRVDARGATRSYELNENESSLSSKLSSSRSGKESRRSAKLLPFRRMATKDSQLMSGTCWSLYLISSTMVLPRTIAEASAQDPLLLLPLPDKLPPSPADQLQALASALQAHIAKSPDALPLPAITGGMRTVTRNAQVLVNAARVGASDARAELDKEDIALRTTEYELARVREQMEQCRAYEWVVIWGELTPGQCTSQWRCRMRRVS